MKTKYWLIIGGIIVVLAIAGFIFGFFYQTRVTIKEVTDEQLFADLLNQPLRTKKEMIMNEMPPYNFIKEPLYITHEIRPTDSVLLHIPVGTQIVFKQAYSRYGAVAGITSYALTSTIHINGKSYPVEWIWSGSKETKELFEKANP